MKNDTTFLRHFLRHDIIRLQELGGNIMIDVIEDVIKSTYRKRND